MKFRDVREYILFTFIFRVMQASESGTDLEGLYWYDAQLVGLENFEYRIVAFPSQQEYAKIKQANKTSEKFMSSGFTVSEISEKYVSKKVSPEWNENMQEFLNFQLEQIHEIFISLNLRLEHNNFWIRQISYRLKFIDWKISNYTKKNYFIEVSKLHFRYIFEYFMYTFILNNSRLWLNLFHTLININWDNSDFKIHVICRSSIFH